MLLGRYSLSIEGKKRKEKKRKGGQVYSFFLSKRLPSAHKDIQAVVTCPQLRYKNLPRSF
jgi:hypothetical protein